MTQAIVAAPPRSIRGLVGRYGYLGWLALPMLIYLVPLLEGYAWSSIGPSYLPYNVLNPPEEYRGRLPATRITAEAWGASVVIVPLQARARQYLLDGELPLWNPYQGLGQPFAAQGEGSPYFPVSMLRSLLPYSKANYLTVATIYASAIFTYLLLIRLGASRPAAIFAGIAWSLSGAVSLHLGRPNIADQVCTVPALFWAVIAAAQCRTVGRYVVLALVSGLHLLAGFIQTAMLSGLTAVLFGVWYAWLDRRWQASSRGWLRDAAMVLGALVLGNALGAFSLLPMLEAMRTSFSKNLVNLGFEVAIPSGNLVGLSTPYLFGQPFYLSWLATSREPVVDWDNLFAFSGLLPAALVAAALPRMLRRSTPTRDVFLFFVIGFLVMLLRYLSAPPAAALNFLPILGLQSPKHATEVMVFFLIVAAGLALDWLPRTCRRHGWIGLAALLIFLVGLVLTVIGRLGGFGKIDPGEILAPALIMTVTVVAIVVLAVGLCLGRDVGSRRTAIVLAGAAFAELSLYVPLGNAEQTFLLARLGLSVVIFVTALLLAWDWRRLAALLGVLALAGYAALVPWPRSGLPRQFDVEQPPTFMRWLAATETPDDRSFGIMPDFSSIAPVQDISAVGPLAPPEFLEYVRLIADQAGAQEYSKTTHFMLSGPWSYDLGQYARARPLLDWVGVRYLVLNRQFFGGNGRHDADALEQPPLSLKNVYEDRRAYVLMSPEAQSRAELWSGYLVADDQAAILARLQRDPTTIRQAPRVEAGQLPSDLPPSAAQPTRTPLSIAAYRPNAVELSFEAASGGLVVVKDVYAAGWSATLNGREVPIVRVNGLVRGVFVPAAGQYTLRFTYLPASFVSGLYVSLATAALLVVLMVGSMVTRSRRRETPARSADAKRTATYHDQGTDGETTRSSPVPSGTADKILPHAP